MWVADQSSFVVDRPVDQSSLQVTSVNPSVCSVTAAAGSFNVIGLAGGQCQIQVLSPANDSYNLASAIFTIRIFAPTIKIAKIRTSKTSVKVTINAGVRYARRVVTLWSKSAAVKKVTQIATPKPIKLNAKGVATVVLAKAKKITYYLKYKKKYIAHLTLK